MIESWWRQLKHQWLFLNTLDSIETVRKLVTFYVQQHNEHVPHSAFKGQTPDEMYFATGADVPEKLLAAQLIAKQARRESNLARSCSACRNTEPKWVAIEPPTESAIPSNTSKAIFCGKEFPAFPTVRAKSQLSNGLQLTSIFE